MPLNPDKLLRWRLMLFVHKCINHIKTLHLCDYRIVTTMKSLLRCFF
jgi:hypothetical protein